MAQKITLKIAGREYHLSAADTDMERRMRLAAEEIDAMVTKYNERFPEKDMQDKLAFVILNGMVNKIAVQEGAKSLMSDVTDLENLLDSYLHKNS